MTAAHGVTFVTSLSRDVLEDWLAVLFEENKAQLESGSAAASEVSHNHVHGGNTI